MDEFILGFIFFIIFIGIPLGFLWFLYFIGTKLQNRKTGITLVSVFSGIYLMCILYVIFEDHLFFKSDAEKILRKAGVVLSDDFKIKDNRTANAIGDYYHTFTLEISKKDKEKLLKSFKAKSDSLKIRNIEYLEYYENDYGYIKETLGLDRYDKEYIFIPKTEENNL